MRAGPRPTQFLQIPASVVRRAGVSRKNSSIQMVYCLGKGVSGSSHTIGVKDRFHPSILPGLVPLGVLLRCGSPEEAGADEQAHFPEKAGRAASRLPCGFVHRSRSTGKLAFILQISKGQEWEVGVGERACRWSALSDTLTRVRFLRVGITLRQGEQTLSLKVGHHTDLVSKP